MSEYHKIQTIYKRYLTNPKKPLIVGQWSEPEFEYLAGNRWQFTEKVDGTKWGDFEAEGIVARPKAELLTRSGHRIIAAGNIV
jgi:hypothetical protein